MSDAEIQKLVDRLPKAQREATHKRIRLMVRYGWSAIGFWEDSPAPDQADLCGLHPSSGMMEFLPATEGDETIDGRA